MRDYNKKYILYIHSEYQFELTGDFMGLDRDYCIRISEDALIQLVLNGLEAYIVSHSENKKATSIETYGLLWGHEVSLPENNGTLYSIELVSIDTSAERDSWSCTPNEKALELKRDVMTSFWPHYDFLGDFHTHPHGNYKYVGDKEINFSEPDIESLEEFCNDWRKHNYRVGLVLTIAWMKKASNKKSTYLQNNLIEFTLGNYRLWIKAYVASYEEGEDGKKKCPLKVSDNNEEHVFLDCAALAPECMTEFTPFGRRKRGKHHSGI